MGFKEVIVLNNNTRTEGRRAMRAIALIDAIGTSGVAQMSAREVQRILGPNTSFSEAISYISNARKSSEDGIETLTEIPEA